MLDAVTEGISTVIGWIGSVISSLTTAGTASAPTLNALLPLFAIGISISAILLGVKIIKSVVWGA